jgi:NADH-quinone oxidoreductase subunit J
MLTTRLSGKPLMIEHVYGFSGTLVGILFFALLVYYISIESFNGGPSMAGGLAEIRTIGVGLMTEFVLPFEVAGILLLVALIGAAIIASTTNAKKT